MNEERLIDLEIRYSHLEEFIRQLNETVISQETVIKRLEKEVLDLKRLVNFEELDLLNKKAD
jgi:uncharacterized coiled-coil protein SlyX